MKKYQKIPKVTMPMGAVFSSSPRSAAPHGCWSTERCARFAARREYHLIKSLVNDRATLAAARDAGLIAAAPIGVAATSTSTPDGEGTATLHKEEVLQRSKRTRRVKTDACKAKERRKLEEKVAKRAAAAEAEKERQAAEAAAVASKKAADERATADAVEAEAQARVTALEAQQKKKAGAEEVRLALFAQAEREERARVREKEERKERAAAEAEEERRLRASLAAARELAQQHAKAEAARGCRLLGRWADGSNDESEAREAGGKRDAVDAGVGTPAKAAGAPAVESGGSERREHRARRIDFGGEHAAEKGGGKGSSKGGGRGKGAFGRYPH